MQAAAVANVKWGSLDQILQKVIIHNVLKFLRPKEVDRLVADWDQACETTLQIVWPEKPPVEPFIDLVDRDGQDEASLKNKRGQDCPSLLLFQKYKIPYQKYLEDEEIQKPHVN